MTKTYTYKVVGVNFDSPDGTNRQTSLKSIYNHAVKELKADPWLDVDYDVSFRSYEFDGSPALAVIINGFDVGNIAADSVTDFSEIIAKKDPYIEAEILLNGNTPEEYVEMLSDKMLYEDELDLIKDDPQYSVKIHLATDDGLPAPPADPPAPRKLDKYEKKLLKATEKAQRKEEKRRAREAKRKK